MKGKLWPFCLSVNGRMKMLRLDIINSVVSAIFTIIVSVLALVPGNTTLTVLGGVSGCVAAAFCMADMFLIGRKLRLNPSGP
ncbi:chemokine-like factor isoform X2 [Sorex araneus]|uniref:chemokine-like factor isoform X2 n=1 Tax=Sorex araneus TaxID=42254 RepID=UPI0024336239|nr:chemokine-like factor isoform X2 [Sorex araneus]